MSDFAGVIAKLRRTLTGTLRKMHWRDIPWVRVGMGVAIGVAIGKGAHTALRPQDGLVRAMVRAGLAAALAQLVSRTLTPVQADS